MNRVLRIARAIAMAFLCHGLFTIAVASMAFALATGFQQGIGRLPTDFAPAANLLLAAQFPLLHSWLLTRRGHRVLRVLSPVGDGRRLAPTTYVVVGSLQLLATFWLWTPSGVVWHTPTGGGAIAAFALFASAWAFLIKALFDAGIMLQSGAAGWWALLKNRSVDYGAMPVHGLFARCRQPIYLGFALVLWTAPIHSLDWLLLTVPWSVYCIAGPRLKEARWETLYGQNFRNYRNTVPYFIPRVRP